MMFTTKVGMWVSKLLPSHNSYNQEGRRQPAPRGVGTA